MTDAQYLIRKYGMYYRPNAQGYTGNVAEAGCYTLAEAIKHSHPNGPDGPRDGIDYVLAPRLDVGEVRSTLEDYASIMVDEVIAATRVRLDAGEGLSIEDQRHLLEQLIVERKRAHQGTAKP